MPAITAEPLFQKRHVLTPTGLVDDVVDTAFENGELAYVESLEQHFKLNKNSTLPLVTGKVLPTRTSNNGALPGRWLLLSTLFGGAVSNTTIVLRPGDPDPAVNVFLNWSDAYNATKSQGLKILQIDDSLVSPVVIPPGVYDLHDVVLSGDISKPGTGTTTEMVLLDGVVFSRFGEITNKLRLRSLATTVPVHTITNDSFFISSRGATFESVGSQPFFRVPAGVINPFFAEILGGGFSGTTPVLEIGAGATVSMILSEFSALPNNIVVGAGQLFVLVSSQAAYVNTPNPIIQGVSTTAVNFFYAQLTQYAPNNPGNWVGAPPANVQDALDRMAALLVANYGPIP